MSYSDAMSYFITVVAIALAPGPCALVLLVRSARQDLSGAIGFGFGYALGSLIIVTAVCFGLGLWITAVPEFFQYSKHVMLTYILWLAWGIWHGSVSLDDAKGADKSGLTGAIAAGILTCFISPYMMILFPLVVPELMDISQIVLPEFTILAALTFASFSIGSLIIIVFAVQIGRLIKSDRSMLMLNRSLASLLMVGGTWMAFG
ncbi:MAG: LysE family transporter [Paracoccaceae bacterium]